MLRHEASPLYQEISTYAIRAYIAPILFIFEKTTLL